MTAKVHRFLCMLFIAWVDTTLYAKETLADETYRYLILRDGEVSEWGLSFETLTNKYRAELLQTYFGTNCGWNWTAPEPYSGTDVAGTTVHCYNDTVDNSNGANFKTETKPVLGPDNQYHSELIDPVAAGKNFFYFPTTWVSEGDKIDVQTIKVALAAPLSRDTVFYVHLAVGKSIPQNTYPGGLIDGVVGSITVPALATDFDVPILIRGNKFYDNKPRSFDVKVWSDDPDLLSHTGQTLSDPSFDIMEDDTRGAMIKIVDNVVVDWNFPPHQAYSDNPNTHGLIDLVDGTLYGPVNPIECDCTYYNVATWTPPQPPEGYEWVLGTPKTVSVAGVDLLMYFPYGLTDIRVKLSDSFYQQNWILQKQGENLNPIDEVGYDVSPSIDGTGLADMVTAAGTDNTISAEQSDDVVLSGWGADTTHGDGGQDILYGEAGNDFVDGGSENDVVVGGSGNDVLVGSLGNDQLIGDDLLSATTARVSTRISQNAVTQIASGNDQLLGGNGDDQIDGGPGSDTASFAGIRADYTVTFNAVTGIFTVIDTVLGRDGTDTVKNVEYFKFSDVIKPAVRMLDVKIDGSEGNDKIVGNKGDDELRGLGANDTLSGLGGDDLLDGGSGADSMSGGDGDDSYIVDDPKDKVKETARPGSGYDTVYTSLPTYTLPTNVENLVYTGVGNFTGKGNKSVNNISGGPSDDILDGKQAGDSMTGKGGNDSYYVDSPADLVNEDPDGGVFDQVISAVTITSLSGNVEGLTLAKGNTNGRGNGLDNFILGSSGLNILEGGDGADTLVGGMGNDSFFGETTSSVGDDADTIAYTGAKKTIVFSLSNTLVGQNTGGAGTDRIYDISSIENLTGSAFNDTLTGNLGPNVISGADGNDTVIGLAGPDVLVGGKGFDLIDCGSDGDADRVAYTVPGDSPAGTGRDSVASFTPGHDVIDLGSIDADTVTDGNQAFLWGATTAAAHSIWYTVSGSDILVSADVSGDTIPEFEVLLKSVASLQEADLVR